MSEVFQQGTPQWLAQRVGKCTASRFDDVTARLASGKGYKATRESYMWELVGEIITGQPSDHYVSTAMMHGMEYEPHARRAFESKTGKLVHTVGFIDHPTIGRCGASPDGLVDGEFGLEIKCPYNMKNHLLTLDSGEMPEQHMAQVQGQMACTGTKGTYFVSYYPFAPEKFRLFYTFVPADPAYIAGLNSEIQKFLLELATLTSHIHDRAEALSGLK